MVRAAIEPPDEPASQGAPASVTLRVTNDGTDYLLLDRAVVDGPHDEVVSWRTRPDGLVVYDAVEDEYRHHSISSCRALVPLETGLVPPGASAVTFLRTKTLAAGPRRARITVSGATLPADAVLDRVYAPPAAMLGAVASYRRVQQALEARGTVIVRAAGLATFEVAAEVALDVDPDDDATTALAQAGPGAVLVDRVRRLGGAWVVEAADGALLVAAAGRSVRVPPGVVDRAVWRHLDERLVAEPAVLQFRGPAAAGAKAEGGLPLGHPELGQQTLPSAALWDLLGLLVARRLGLRVGRHTPTSDGLIIE